MSSFGRSATSPSEIKPAIFSPNAGPHIIPWPPAART